MQQLSIRELPAARDHMVMRELRVRELPAAVDRVGTGFIIAVIVCGSALGLPSPSARQ